MGGCPTWSLLTLGVPEKSWESDLVKRFYDGWTGLADEFDVELIGGDISRSSELVIDSIAGGEVPRGKAILRSGASAGDAIYVSGSLGGASAGLRFLERLDQSPKDELLHQRLVERQLRPMPRVELGRWLLEHQIPSAMIDLSDGLSSDIHHICELSGVGADLDASLLPLDVDLANSFTTDEALALALNGGEDFELLFCVPEEKLSLLENADVSYIGSVTESAGLVQLKDGDKTIELRPSGYRHF
jgi:thiamine-monophosphate kinase